MILITPHKKSYSLPTEWNELTGEQLLQVMHTFTHPKYDDVQRLLKLLKIIAGMSWWQFFRLGVKLEEFIYLVAFLYNGNTLTKQLLPHYYCKTTGHTFYGPASEFDNLVMKEFVFSEDYFMRWTEEKEDNTLLDLFVAVLYRHPKYNYDFEKNEDGDARVPFNENVAKLYARSAIRYWPAHVKLAIAHWYSACRQKLVEDNEDVFGGSGEPAKYGLLQVMDSVAKEGGYGDFKEVENQYVHLVMVSLNISVHRAREIEKQSKR